MNNRMPRAWCALGVSGVLICLMLMTGCGKADKSDATDRDAAKSSQAQSAPDKDKDKGQVEVTPEQAEKIGLRTANPKPAEYADEAPGYGTIVAHEALAQAVAEVATAEAAKKQSEAALARSQRLAGTAGALSTDVSESNVRQAAVDSTALNLAKQRVTANFGQDPPWHSDMQDALPRALAAGTDKLVRVTFPLGTLFAGAPKALRISHLGASQSDPRWPVAPLWHAPADSAIPGRSFFGVIAGAEFAEGERVIAWAPIGKPKSGVVVPQAAVVVSDDKYWCYVAKNDNTFVRTEIDAGVPLEDGYFVTRGVNAEDRIVVNGAALLLAQETNSGATEDD